MDFASHCVSWYRYLNDIFIVWRGDVGSLSRFHERLNGMHPSISFTLAHDTEQIKFLDVMVCKKQEGGVDTTLYVKPTDRNQLLHYKSYHPKHVKKSIPVSQLTRVNRTVCDPDERFKQQNLMCQKFRKRGYPEAVICEARGRIDHKRTKRKDNRKIPFITFYNSQSQQLNNTLRRH